MTSLKMFQEKEWVVELGISSTCLTKRESGCMNSRSPTTCIGSSLVTKYRSRHVFWEYTLTEPCGDLSVILMWMTGSLSLMNLALNGSSGL